MWFCDFSVLWLFSFVTVRFYDCSVLWLFGNVTVQFYDCSVLWLFGNVTVQFCDWHVQISDDYTWLRNKRSSHVAERQMSWLVQTCHNPAELIKLSSPSQRIQHSNHDLTTRPITFPSTRLSRLATAILPHLNRTTQPWLADHPPEQGNYQLSPSQLIGCLINWLCRSELVN